MRAAYNPNISFFCTYPERDLIKAKAAELGVSTSALVRRTLSYHMEKGDENEWNQIIKTPSPFSRLSN